MSICARRSRAKIRQETSLLIKKLMQKTYRMESAVASAESWFAVYSNRLQISFCLSTWGHYCQNIFLLNVITDSLLSSRFCRCCLKWPKLLFQSSMNHMYFNWIWLGRIHIMNIPCLYHTVVIRLKYSWILLAQHLRNQNI